MDINKFIEENEIIKDSVISIIGMGGKTTLLLYLGNELSKRYKTLIGTTTKLGNKKYVENEYNSLDAINKKNPPNLALLYEHKNDKKIWGPELDVWENARKLFDILVLEADGSMSKPLKAWRDDEPVFLDSTTHSICIFPLWGLGKSIDEENVLRLELFKNHYSDKIIDIDLVNEILSGNNTPFKHKNSKHILLLNAADKIEKEELNRIRKYYQEREVKYSVYLTSILENYYEKIK